MNNEEPSTVQSNSSGGFLLLSKANKTVNLLHVILAFVLSFFLHLLLILVVGSLKTPAEKQKIVQKVTIREQPRPVATPAAPVVEKTAAPPPPKPPSKQVKKREPKVREDKRVKPPEPQAQPLPQEIRGGLSDSTSLNGKGSSIGIAEGNSAEISVDPSKANLPPPAAVATAVPADPDASPVSEAAADIVAVCSRLSSDIAITDDAANAGLTSGRVVVDVVIGSKGNVIDAKLVERTGYEVDKVVLEAVKKLSCTPAKKNGVNVAQKRRFEIPITQ